MDLVCFVNGDYLALRVVLVDCYFLLCWVFCFVIVLLVALLLFEFVCTV